MESTIIDIVHLTGVLSQTELLSGDIETGRTPSFLVDSHGNFLVDSSDNLIVDAPTGLEVEGSLSSEINISADIVAVSTIQADLISENSIEAQISLPKNIGGVPYTGEYEITPTNEVQILDTQGKSMQNNVTINPIPSNYGLITWNGSFLTVS